jgi:prevent-host-death family protein
MQAIAFTEFRRNASNLLTEVEQGKTFLILRHGRPVAEISPVSEQETAVPAWKQPGIKLRYPGAELSDAILAERSTTP